mmetsp:Transcript_861/g.2672  ORF Transcript_861/g.2672 Transcript_861/m.2672 type:complete len:81 (-) Transcript_861:1369-1611(-)
MLGLSFLVCALTDLKASTGILPLQDLAAWSHIPDRLGQVYYINKLKRSSVGVRPAGEPSTASRARVGGAATIAAPMRWQG